jgi:hypothetical protein
VKIAVEGNIHIKFFVQVTDNFKKMRHSAVACKQESVIYLLLCGTAWQNALMSKKALLTVMQKAFHHCGHFSATQHAFIFIYII